MSFVGREAELDLLAREVAMAFELPAGRTIFVQGSPGAGKTSLIMELLERLHAERPDVAIGRGRCLQTFGSADPYLPMIDALRDLSDESTPGSVEKETLSGMITELAPYWLSVIPMVGSLLSAGFATAARLRGAQPAAAPSREALFVQYKELIQRLALRGPLVLFLDDLHWADQSSIALLEHLSRGLTNLPVLILGTLRSDEADLEKHPITTLIRELEREGLGRALELGELESGALDALLQMEFGGDVSPPLRRWVMETAGGNPLFASELARLLRQSGAAVEVQGEWQLTEAVSLLAVPRSAEAVIETRVQRLDPEEVRLLQYASVEGNDFNSVVLAGLLERDELELLDALEAIERRYRLVRATGEVELPDGDIATTFSFHHALVQTVLYRQVTGKRRILLHRKAGELLERIFTGSVDRVAGKLARHFHEGRVGEAAFRHARHAADAARRMYAHWEAEELLRIALEHSPDEAETLRLRERLGDVYDGVGYYQQGLGEYERALAGPVDALTGVRLRRKMANLERKAGTSPAPALLQRLRGLLAEAAVFPEEHCRLLLAILSVPGAMERRAMAAQAVEIAEALGDPSLLALTLEQWAVTLTFDGEPQEALPLLERAFEVGGRTADPLRAVRYFNISGIAYDKLGQYRQALHCAQQMLDTAERIANPQFISIAYNNAAYELLILGEYDQAEEVLQKAHVVNERRYRSGLAHSFLNLAKRAHWSGDLPLALERYRRLLECARELEYWTSEAVAHAGIGLCHLELGQLDAARHAADQALAAVADRDEWFLGREFVEILLAHLQAIEGAAQAAAHRLTVAARHLQEGDLFVWTQVELERVRVLRQFDTEAARRVLSEVAAATRGIEFALDGEIEALVRELGPLASEMPAPPALP